MTIVKFVSITSVFTLINCFVSLSSIRAEPEGVSSILRLSAERFQFQWADLGANDVRLAQLISIRDLPALEAIDPESESGAGGDGNRDGAGSNRTNNRPRRNPPPGHHRREEDEKHKHRERDDDDDD